MKIENAYPSRSELVTVLGTRDYVEFSSADFYDGEFHEYLCVPSLRLFFVKQYDNSYRLGVIGDLYISEAFN